MWAIELDLRPKGEYPSLASAVLVTGKGGVGKTTVAAGFALASQRQGVPAVFVEFGDGESGARALGQHREEVEHIFIHPDHAVSRAATPLLGSPVVAKLVLGNFAMRRVLRAAPGLRELAMLESVRLIAESRPKHRIIVDMPATGHGLAWMRVPAQVDEITSPGPFKSMVQRLRKELIAPGRCSVVVVTLPEPLVMQETVELCAAIEEEVGLQTDRLIVNQVPPATDPRALVEAQELVEAKAPNDDQAQALAEVLRAREQARQLAMEGIVSTIERSTSTPFSLPQRPVDPSLEEVAGWLIEGGLV